MSLEHSEELLGIRGKEKNYLIEMDWIVQICTDVQISPFPCLPPQYIGMYNYKGEIIPVISLQGQDPRILLVIKCRAGLFAMAVSSEPSVIGCNAIKKIDGPHSQGQSEIWMEKGLYQCEDAIFSLLDIEGTVEKI